MEDKKTRYFLDVNTFEEEVRVRDQAYRLNRLYPVSDEMRERISQMERIFDLGCGSGTWAMDRAREFPGCHFYGLDIAERMIKYAQAQALANRVENVTFQTGDALEKLPYPDASFDYIYGRMINVFVPCDRWLDTPDSPGVLNECSRVLKPGGFIRLIGAERPLSNKPAHTQFCAMAAQLITRNGISFSPDGQTFGICNMLAPMLIKAGFVIDAQQAASIDYSAWSPDHRIWCDNDASVINRFAKALADQHRPPQEIEEAQRLVQQALAEMDEEDFCAMIFFLSVVARKPE